MNINNGYYTVSKQGEIEYIENLFERFKQDESYFGSKTAFASLHDIRDIDFKPVEKLIFNSSFKLIDIEQVKAEWFNAIGLASYRTKRAKTIRFKSYRGCDGRRMCRRIRTTNERRLNHRYTDSEEMHFEPVIRGRRRSLPCNREDIHSGTKTKNWKYNRKQQYKT